MTDDKDRYIAQLEARLASEDPRRVTLFRNSDKYLAADNERYRMLMKRSVAMLNFTLAPGEEPTDRQLEGIALIADLMVEVGP